VQRMAKARKLRARLRESIRQRAFELHKRHSWKTQGRGAKFMSGAGLWGAEATDPFAMPITLAGCACGSNGDLYYSLQTPEISGLLCLKSGSHAEQRLLHTSDFRIGHIAVQPDTHRVALSLQHHGSAPLLLCKATARGFPKLRREKLQTRRPTGSRMERIALCSDPQAWLKTSKVTT
jgi:hypothetical protein